MRWSREDLAWVAGIVEGEGTLGCIKDSRTEGTRDRGAVVVLMADKDIIERLQKIMGMGVLGMRSPPEGSGWKLCWRWGVYRRGDVYALLTAIWPWLGIRRQAKATAVLTGLPPVGSQRWV